MVVNLQNNEIQELPDFPSSPTLAEVLLGHNGLKSVQGISKSPGIATLQLRENQLSELPDEIARLPLKVLGTIRRRKT